MTTHIVLQGRQTGSRKWVYLCASDDLFSLERWSEAATLFYQHFRAVRKSIDAPDIYTPRVIKTWSN